MNTSIDKSVLVIGATGNLGQKAVSRFHLEGYTVRALVRNQNKSQFAEGVEVVQGDLRNPTSIEAAMEGMDYVHISVSAGNDPNEVKEVEEDGVIQAIAIAEKMGIQKVSFISGMSANLGNVDNPSEDAKVKVENYLKNGEVNFTIFKPGFFAETLARFVQGNRAIMLGSQPHKFHVIIMDDLMKNISKSYQMSETDRQVYYVHGAESPILLKEALQQYIDHVHPGMKITTMPIGVMKIVNKLFIKGNLTRTLETMSILQTKGEEGDSSDYYSTFGRDHTKFQDWLKQQKVK